MQGSPWTCQYAGCRSTAEQIATLRLRRPDGFPHDEDQNLRVCTVCRRLPLKEQPAEEDQLEQLDRAFIAGIKEELASIVENEKNIQALSQVFRYYAKHAKQLSQVLVDFTTRQCFPWELIHALHLVDDILLMDNTGRYKAEFVDRVHAIAVSSFRKVQSDQERREIGRMLHAWQELKIFDPSVLEAIKATIRSSGAQAALIIDEVGTLDEDDDDAPAPQACAEGGGGVAPPAKKPKVGENSPVGNVPQVVGSTPAAKLSREKMVAILDRILGCPVERSFEMLGIAAEGSDGHDIRKAYRRIALLIHPDKNPGMEAQCQEALIKLQQGREQAETDLQRFDSGGNSEIKMGETRSAATAAAATAAVDASFKCKYPGCDLAPCKQCANGCCTRNITHCHLIARGKGGMQCFFHPPPRAWARNA